MDIKKTKTKDPTLSKGIYGSPKKGGAGGKGTWGKGGADDLIEAHVDAKDPNYNSDDEAEIDAMKKKKVVMKKIEGHSPIQAILEEYFTSGDLEEASNRLRELTAISMTDFVEKAVYAAMEQQPFERELTSKLLSNLYGKTLTHRNISDGFQSALDSLEENMLDIPQAPDMLAKFFARAILDEIVPPSFLKSAWAENATTQNTIALATGLVNNNHRSKRLEHIWGPGDLESVKRLKREASTLVSEFIVNEDKVEADRALRSMNAPHFHFQVVRQALQMALSASDKNREAILRLLGFLYETGLLCASDMEQGFSISSKGLEDTKLDIPSAPATFNSLIKTAQDSKWLSADYKL